jgi:DNA-binding NtrC family response regulator
MRLGSARFGKAPKPFEKATLEWFDRYSWPGNVRELENLVYREFLLSEGPAIAIAAPAELERAADAGAAFNHRRAKARAIDEFEADFLRRVLGEANGNVTVAARLCGTERRHLGRLLRKYQLTKT